VHVCGVLINGTVWRLAEYGGGGGESYILFPCINE
jgi:hypothetical protein